MPGLVPDAEPEGDGLEEFLEAGPGQGSRLGSDKPKGMYPVGPVTGASLFEIHAQKVLALRRRYGTAVPFLVMTSPATHADTEAYFEGHDYFGLPPGDVFFFQQGTMPALDRATGKLLLERPGQLFLSPNGHGGTLTALADSGLLADPNDAATFEYRPAPPELLERARRISEVCARHDVPLAAAAIRFPLGHPAVGCVVVGMRDVPEVATNIGNLRLPIPEALWADLKAAGLLREDAPVPPP